MPEINIYAPDGSFVGSAAGNASDGRNDVFTFTATQTGQYRVQVTAADKTSVGEYTLSVQGSDTTAAPFTVTSTNPADGDYLGFQVSSMDVQFSDTVLATSLSTSDFTIDGGSATGFSVNASNDVTFYFAATSNGTHNVSISGVMDIHGTTLTTDNVSFATNDVAPVVVSSSISNGDVLSPGTITEVVKFNEPVDPASVGTFDISLLGIGRGIFYTPASITPDGTDTVYTIVYNNIPTDAYQFTLISGPSNFTNLAGVPMVSDYTVNFTVPWGTNPFPVPLKPVAPLGSLTYQGSIENVITGPGETDTYTLPLLANQTLDLLVTPESGGLQPVVSLYAPDGTLIASVTSSGPGQAVYLTPQFLTTQGVYSFTVSDLSGNIGFYKIQAILNAATDPGGTGNSTVGTAIPIDTYATPTPYGSSRISVLGTIKGGNVTGDALVVETGFNGDVALVNEVSGAIEAKFTSPAFSNLYLFDVALAPDNTFYVLGDVNIFTAEIIHMDLSGNTLGTIVSPVSDPGGFLSPEGFGLDPNDGSFWIGLVNSNSILHLDSSGNFLAEYSVGTSVNDVAVGPDGLVYYTNIFGSSVNRLDPSTGGVSFFASSEFPST